VLNLLAMYQLGTLVESWYGSHQLVMIYGLTGGGGNLIAALIRYGRGENPAVHSGGGSVVSMGLVVLCGIIGWRSGGPKGMLLSRLMLGVLILTALLGLAFPNYIDNWGHAGGALMGLAVGLAHTRLVRNVSKPSAWGAGVLTGLVIVGSGAAQWAADRREAPARQEAYLVRCSAELQLAAGILRGLGQLPPQRPNLENAVATHKVHGLRLNGTLKAQLPGIQAAVDAAMNRRLSPQERHDLQERLASALRFVRAEFHLGQTALRQLRRQPHYRPLRGFAASRQ
jgi:hypothetical protein